MSAAVEPPRPLRVEEIDALAARLAALPLLARYGRSAGALAASLGEALRRGDLLLVAGQPPAGVVWIQAGAAFGVGAYLRLLAAAPGDQGRGLGGLLLDEGERRARTAGARSIFLLVSDFNEGARRFYERRGYVEAGRLPGFVLDDVVERILWKRLA